MSNKRQFAKYYFFYFAALGLVAPFLGVWLESIYKTNMAMVISAYQATMMIAPIVWGRMAGGSGNPIKWLSNGTLGAAIFAAGLITIKPGIPEATAMFILAAFGVFFTPLLPHLESLVYRESGGDAGVYSKIRFVGSASFMVVSIIFGGIVINHPEFLPLIIFGFLAFAWLVSLPGRFNKLEYVGNIDDESDSNDYTISEAFKTFKSLWLFWVLAITSQVGFFAYSVYFALHMKAIGYSGQVIGGLIGFSIAAEVLAFMFMSKFIHKLKPWAWIAVGMFLTAIRWLIIKNADEAGIAGLTLAQATNAIGFSVVHASCVKILFDRCGHSMSGLFQSIYTSFAYGVGGVVGVGIAGAMWASGGGKMVFDGAFYASLVAFIVACIGGFVSRKK